VDALAETTFEFKSRQRVGTFLKKRREQAGLTQRAVSDHLGYSTAQFVSNWERGVSMAPMQALPQLAHICAVPAKEMIAVMHRYQKEICEGLKQELSKVFRKER
jgi:transcriptional regulator with XRE-family HTH domain